MRLVRCFLFCICAFIFLQCENDKKREVKFSDDINRYNYLDKLHDIKYVYDFEDIFNIEESKELHNKLLKLKLEEGITFILITDDNRTLNQSFIENTIKTNEIFMSKYDLDKSITIKLSKSLRKIGIAYSKNLEQKLNDSICNHIIEDGLKPFLKEEKYYIGVDKSVDLIMNYINN